MKVAFCNRPSWDAPLGGDGVQMLKTKEALERRYDIKIDIVTDAKAITSEYDIVHIFNFVTLRETKSFFDRAIELKIPIASSCIFGDYTYACTSLMSFFIGTNFSGLLPRIFRFGVHAAAFCLNYPKLFTRKFKNMYRYFCENSGVILPNSIEEGNLLQQFVGRLDIGSKIKVVYNGVDYSNRTDYMQKHLFFAKYKLPENYILEVARIEPVKNQINLVYALKDHKDIPIVFVGKIQDVKYFKKIKKLADRRGNVYFVDAVPHDEIANFYKYARLHVLLSLRESPGLVSLEALANDCPIVVANSKYAPVETYFPSQPYVVDPLDMKDIRNTILQAHKERRLVKDDMKSFTWDTAAKQTYEGYCRLQSGNALI